MIIKRSLNVETLQRLLALLPSGRARQKYEAMLRIAFNPLKELVFKEVELVLLHTELTGNPAFDYHVERETRFLEREVEAIRTFINGEHNDDG